MFKYYYYEGRVKISKCDHQPGICTFEITCDVAPYKYDFGTWHHRITKFTSFEDALKWLKTEENDFRTREFISKAAAKKLGYVDPEEELKYYPEDYE